MKALAAMLNKLKVSENRTAWIAFLAFVGLGLAGGLLGLAWPSMQSQFTQPLDGVNSLFLVQTIAYSLVGFYISRIMARFGSGHTLIVGAFILSLSLLGIAFAPLWGVVIVASTLAGFGSGLIDAGLNLYVATYHTPQQMSFLHAFFGIGITAGPLLMTATLQSRFGWQGGYIVTALALVAVLLLFFVTRNIWRNSGFQNAANETVERAPFNETLRVPNVWLSTITYLAYVGLEMGVGQWAYTLLIDSRHIAPEVAGPWLSIYWGAFTGSRILFGFIANRFKIATILRTCMMAVILSAIVLMWNPSEWLGLASLAVIGFAQGPIFAMLMSGTAERVGARHAANAISVQMAGVGLGAVILPSLLGTIGKNNGLEMMAVVFVVMAVITFAFHELTLRLPHEHDKAKV